MISATFMLIIITKKKASRNVKTGKTGKTSENDKNDKNEDKDLGINFVQILYIKYLIIF